MTPTYSGSPAFGAPYRAPHMALQTSVNSPVSNREPSGSRSPPVPNPDLAGRSTGEQAVIVALQAVANYPNSSDFVRALEQRIPGLATYLQAAGQPSGCNPPPTSLVVTASMDVEVPAGPSGSAMVGSREEAGRKRMTGEDAAIGHTSSVTESSTSRPPPDKRVDVPRPQMNSVVIARPLYRVGHLGRGAPQMTMMEDANERYGTPEAGSEVSSVPSGTTPTDMSLEAPEAIEEAHAPAFLPPSDDMSGSVETNDCKRIWMAAERLYANMYAIKKRAPPTDADQKEVNRTTIAAQVTWLLRPRDADMTEQAWEQRAREQLPATPNDYMAPLQHNITEQFPARYVLREAEAWEANARDARNIIFMKPQLKGALQSARATVWQSIPPAKATYQSTP